MAERNSRVLLGLDGGGTKTAGVILSVDGRVLAEETGPGSAIVGEPSERACEVLNEIINALCTQVGVGRADVLHCGLGLNGVDFADEAVMQHRALANTLGLPQDRLTLVNDAIVALWGAAPQPAATILQHGTAFTSAYRAQYGEETLFDNLDVAHAFDMRYELLSMVARMIQGWIPATPLKDRVLAYFGINDEKVYADTVFCQRIPRHLKLGTVPIIFQAWQEGDSAAITLVERTIKDYALAAGAMIRATGSDCPAVVFGGGVVAQAPDTFWMLLTDHLRIHYPSLTPQSPLLPPSLGAAIMAGFDAGIDPEVMYTALLKI